MNASFKITVEFESKEDAAYAFMFLSRCGFSEFYDRTEPHLSKETRTERAYQMRNAVGCIERAMDNASVSPRIYE